MSNTLTVLKFSVWAKAQRREGHLLRGTEVQEVLQSLIFLFGTLIPADSKSEVHVIKPLYTFLIRVIPQNNAVP
jgi:hypothetical protein